MVRGKAAGQDKKLLIEDAKKRAAGIDSYVDMIPARFYIGSESQQIHNSRGPGLDPARVLTTSALVAQAAAAEARKQKQEQEGGEEGGGAGKKSKKQKKKDKQKNGEGPAPKNHSELKAKLHAKIAALKEDRRQKQSEADKVKHKAAKREPEGSEGGATTEPKAKKAKASRSAEEDAKKAKVSRPAEEDAKKAKVSRPAEEEDEVAEAGRLTFSSKDTSAALPFEVSVGKRGDKQKRLRQQLRKEETNHERVKKAEQQGRGDEVRKELEMKKALARARGEKVHDDTMKLRKAHKVMQTKKQKAKAKWDERVEQEKQTGKERQDKRKANIDAKRDKNRDKKFGHIKEIDVNAD